MSDLNTIRSVLSAQKKYLHEKYGIKEIGIFGSYIHGQNDPDSDLDILIELERPPKISLIGVIQLEIYLSDLLGVKVDLAIKRNLRKRIGQRILNEVEYV